MKEIDPYMFICLIYFKVFNKVLVDANKMQFKESRNF